MADYPTEKELKIIENWDFRAGWKKLFEFIEGIWWAADWGWTQRGKRVIKYDISTGGWSGNADIIWSMKTNFMFWSMCWISHRRGGHFRFEVRPIKGDSPNKTVDELKKQIDEVEK